MHIIFITQELFPYVEKSSLAKELVHFAKSLKQSGHSVSAVLPSIREVDVKAHSLARRLSGVTACREGKEISCARYDGRTADGISVYFLDISEDLFDRGTGRTSIFPIAAAALTGSFAEAPDACISFGIGLSGFSAEARQYPQLAETVLIANLQDVREGPVDVVPGADRMIVSKPCLIPKESGATGRTVVIPKAAPAAEMKDKPSQKTAFQMKVGFAVRSDVPLTLFLDFSTDALAAHLSSDVQAIVLDDRQDCPLQKERYPDRLKTISKTDILCALGACDACVVGEDGTWVPSCLTRGTIPIVSSALKDDVVDLEPSLASGTGIVVRSLDPPFLIGGLSRLTAAFHCKDAFKAFVSRLPGYAMTWHRVAAYALGLVEEVKTENR